MLFPTGTRLTTFVLGVFLFGQHWRGQLQSAFGDLSILWRFYSYNSASLLHVKCLTNAMVIASWIMMLRYAQCHGLQKFSSNANMSPYWVNLTPVASQYSVKDIFVVTPVAAKCLLPKRLLNLAWVHIQPLRKEEHLGCILMITSPVA